MGRGKLRDVVFLTGATGFLGTQIMHRLIKKDNIVVIILVRGEDYNDAKQRLYRAWWEWPDLTAELEKTEDHHGNVLGNKVCLLNGDISKDGIGLDKDEYKFLTNNITHIIHAAADLRLNSPIKDLRQVNLKGTLNIIKLAKIANENHSIKKFSHISTAYVAGGQNGTVMEDSLTDEHGFLSNYEKSKFEGESAVKRSGLPITIFRPGMVVGDSETGYIKTFNTIYVLLRLYLTNKLRLLPISKDSRINLVPVDYVADAVVKLTFDKKTDGLTFHLTAPYNSLPSIEDFINFVRVWAYDNLDLKLSKPIFLPASTLPTALVFLKLLGTSTQGLRNTINELAPYMNEDRKFSRKNISRFDGSYDLDWKKFLPKLLQYAVYNGFFHRSERTVHEQVLFRLKSNTRQIKCYDVEKQEFIERKSDEIRTEILTVLESLKALGVGPGDRVAIIGYNSTRYLTLDVSIGLLGAVSVPLYYTSPVSEINEILKDCNPVLIFVGTENLIEHPHELETNSKIISLCLDHDEPTIDILSWENFLELGTGNKKSKSFKHGISAPVDFNDVATIRYTSGTTGNPQGVIFTHGNLRWMAEFIASMPPWKDRTQEVSYLSFLPMNHVVEGILGTYSPYYAPTSLKIYFLEDFKDLENTLPRVKPTIFFSVPRFYEKLWTKISQSRWGSMYHNSEEGPKKNILRRILRRSVLKRAGLDACAQLIVGSAPVSTELLKSYQELGIQIHNAYGLTEAPLVTINRLGSNTIGTVGQPLPNTDVKINDTGEVIVRGPQVTAGYFNDQNNNTSIFKDGWLLTGDYGYIGSENSLTITGRKKEMIVNSYGKSISPLKIEGLLKNIGNVSEVMIVGDEKPYCVALIWVEENLNPEKLSEAIEQVNTQLSNPEKIKRWAVLKNDLSIDQGDLTANLKLKRTNIIKRHQNLLNQIYDGSMETIIDDCELNVIHIKK